MLSTLFFALFITSIHAWSSKAGETSNWIPCGSDGSICHIDFISMLFNDTAHYTPSSQYNTIFTRYGDGRYFIYKEISAYSNAFPCTSTFFGDPSYGLSTESKNCEYKIIDRTEPTTMSIWGDKNGDSSYVIPNGQIRMMHYGGHWIAYVMGWIKFSTNLFGGPTMYYSNKKDIGMNPIYGNQPSYDITKEDMTYRFGAWKHCAIEGAYCVLPYSSVIYAVMFGSFQNNTNTIAPIRYPSGIIQRVSGGKIYCGVPSMPDIQIYYTDYPDRPRHCMYSVEPIFNNTVGYWKLVGSCANCSITLTLSEGVTSTSTESTTRSWAKQYSDSTNENMHFFGMGASHTTTTTTSKTITRTVSNSYTMQYGKSCTASCKAVTMWQWVLDTDELCTDGYCRFSTYTCNYICRSDFDEPKCPLTTCIDSECNKCNDY